jgi:hypothetical protein
MKGDVRRWTPTLERVGYAPGDSRRRNQLMCDIETGRRPQRGATEVASALPPIDALAMARMGYETLMPT